MRVFGIGSVCALGVALLGASSVSALPGVFLDLNDLFQVVLPGSRYAFGNIFVNTERGGYITGVNTANTVGAPAPGDAVQIYKNIDTTPSVAWSVDVGEPNSIPGGFCNLATVSRVRVERGEKFMVNIVDGAGFNSRRVWVAAPNEGTIDPVTFPLAGPDGFQLLGAFRTEDGAPFAFPSVASGGRAAAADFLFEYDVMPSAPTAPAAAAASTCGVAYTLSTVLTGGASAADRTGVQVTFAVDTSSSAAEGVAQRTCTATSDASGAASCTVTFVAPSPAAGFPVVATTAAGVGSPSGSVVVSARVLPVSGVTYTGPLSVSTRGYLAASASAAPISVDGANVDGVASFSYGSATSCSSPATLVDGVYSGRCQLTAPLSSGNFALTSTVSYTANACDVYEGSVDTTIAVLELAATRDAQSAATIAVRANVTQLAALEASLALQVSGEVSRAGAAESALSAAVASEGARASAAESALQANVSALALRLSAAEAQLSAPAVFVFRGLSASVSVSYVAPQRPGFGAANQLNFVLKFDQSLASTAAGVISYTPSTGVLSISAPGSYRLDAFVHLYDVTGGSVGTGAVAWMTPDGVPVGPNILNANGGGVAQGVPGDDSIISSIVTLPPSVSAAAPFTCKLVLLSMNQKQATITDASTFAVTKLK